jgi:hypothetical protein
LTLSSFLVKISPLAEYFLEAKNEFARLKRTIFMMKYLTSLLLLLLTPPLLADNVDLLAKQPDGSVQINALNGWAIARGLCASHPESDSTSEQVASKIWGDALSGLTDNFDRHTALQGYVKVLDDATARAKSITNVTYQFLFFVGAYDFNSQSFPTPYRNNVQMRSIWPCTCVSFDQMLMSKIPEPDEAKAREMQNVFAKYKNNLTAVVHGTLKEVLKTNDMIQDDPNKPEIEWTGSGSGSVMQYRIVISPTSVDYHLGDAKGPITCTQTFGANPSISPVVIPANPTPAP